MTKLVLKNRWEKLPYWKKGAVLGTAFHLLTVPLLVLGLALARPLGAIAGTALIFPIVLIEMAPQFLLSLLLATPQSELNLFVWFTFSTVFYGVVGGILGKGMDLALTQTRVPEYWRRLTLFWENRPGWQKGAILGGGLSFTMTAGFYLAFFIFLNVGLVNEHLSILLLYPITLIGAFPDFILSLFLKPSLTNRFGEANNSITTIIFLVYSTVVYAGTGAILGRLLGTSKSIGNQTRGVEHGV